MRQVNFTLIFVICLALVLFGLENTQLVTINIIPGTEFRAPLSVELVVTMGLGAVLAWIFSVWVSVSSMVTTREVAQEKDVEIETLQANLERYKVELEEQRRLLPSSSSASTD